MSPTAESIWRELHTHAGPSSAIPFLPENFFDGVSVDPAVVESGLSELVEIGAVVTLTEKELAALAHRKRVDGEFVVAARPGAYPTHIRIVDPIDIKQSIAAQIESLHRELASCTAQRIPLPEPVPANASNVEAMIAVMETEKCYYQLANGLILQCVIIDGEPRFEIDRWWTYETLLHRWGFVQYTAWQYRWFIPRGKAVSEVIERVLAEVKMDFMIYREFTAVEDHCAGLESSLERLAAFTLPVWASVTTDGSPARDRIPKEVQQEVWRRDRGRCVECGSQEKLEFDHIIPWAKGGSCTARNIQLLCESCNRKKSDRI